MKKTINVLCTLFVIFCYITSNAQVISTFAGNGTAGYSGDGGGAGSAEISGRGGIAADASGNIYFADVSNHRIRKVSTSGVITTFAGNGTAGFSGDGGPATAAELNYPIYVAIDGSGNCYISDAGNNRIRVVSTAGTITTTAGNGTSGYTGDGGAATAAEINPYGIAVDASSNVYFADVSNQCVREITSSGIINTIAGTGSYGFSGDGGAATSAQLANPTTVAVDGSGNLYVADQANYRIRKITSGVITTIAGMGSSGSMSDGVPATTARLSYPTGVAVDAAGNIYIADFTAYKVRIINTAGIINTYAGGGSSGHGYYGDGGAATAAGIDTAIYVATDGSGNVYIAASMARIRKVTPPSPSITDTTTSIIFTGCIPVGTSSYTDSSTFSGSFLSPATGNITVTAPSNFKVSQDGTTWVTSYAVSYTGGVVTPSTIYLQFDPTAATTYSGNVSITGGGTSTSTVFYTSGIGGSGSSSVAAITGASSVCAGGTVTLSDATSGGTWSSSTTSVATVDASGVVTGVAAGSTTISYSVTGACGPVAAVLAFTVSTAPMAGYIMGSLATYAGDTLTYIDTSTGGAWSCSNPSIGTIDASTGFFTALAVGTDVITYTVTTSCGTNMAIDTVTVSAINRISGNVNFGGSPIDSTGTLKVWLITYNSSTLDLEAADSTYPAIHGSPGSVHYSFSGAVADSYRVKAAYFPATFDSVGYVPTYHTSSLHWSGADVFLHSTTVADDYKDINMLYGTVTSGPGFIGGLVTSGADRGTSSGIPVVGLLVYIINPTTGAVIRQTYTNTSGAFSFGNLPVGQSYMIYPEALNYATTPYAAISLTASSPTVSTANFVQHTVSKTITPTNVFTTAISQPAASITVFPNPATDKITIQYFGNTAEKGTVTITDIIGREAINKEISFTKGSGNSNVDISGLAAGIYLVAVHAGDLKWVNKVEVRK